MAISVPNQVLPSGELSKLLTLKVPIETNGVKGQNYHYVQNWMNFLLLGKESIAPIFDPKYRYHVTFEWPKIHFPP